MDTPTSMVSFIGKVGLKDIRPNYRGTGILILGLVPIIFIFRIQALLQCAQPE